MVNMRNSLEESKNSTQARIHEALNTEHKKPAGVDRESAMPFATLGKREINVQAVKMVNKTERRLGHINQHAEIGTLRACFQPKSRDLEAYRKSGASKVRRNK